MTNWLSKIKTKYSEIKPLEHFDEFSHGDKTSWSIQTERTHGIKGLVKISKSKLEDPGLSMDLPNNPRAAGAENIFLGSRQDAANFAKRTYPGTTKIRFV